MSDTAVFWAHTQIAPCGRSKHLLQRLASFADDDGECWASVPTLAEELQASDRTIQRLLRKLETAGLIMQTGRFHARNIPLYQLALHKVGALAQRRAERVAERSRKAANGDTGVTVGAIPNGDSLSPFDPRTVTSATANGDTGVTREAEEKQKKERARERDAFDRVAEAWKADDPDRFSRPKALDAWANVLDDAAIDPDALATAATGFVGEGKAKRGRLPFLHFWLKDRLFEGRLGAAAAASLPASRFADETIRAAAVGAKGEIWVRSWLDPSGWDPDRRRIKARTAIGAAMIERELRRELAKLGISVVQPEVVV